ncbi:MAG: hypothetical protein RLZZ312_109 [Bacteroidota bacterium]
MFLTVVSRTTNPKTMQKNFLLLAVVFISINLFSQKSSLSGTITNNEKFSVQNAVIALLTPKDSILYKFTRSDQNGKFDFKNLKTGSFIIMTCHSRFADYVENIDVTANDNTIGSISLMSKAELLKEIIIKTGSMRIKGDTTSYRASDFKVGANANVDELLRKLPGIQVGKNGEIKAMGETVKKVLVDGEEFFGDDPSMAVKNLRADAVKEVQVFDKKSDQAAFTGIDDGNTQKTINLKLKEDKKKGYFGKIDAANGPMTDLDSRYNTNILFSSFKAKRKLSAFLLNGNTGQDGLDWQDSEKFGGGNNNFSMDMDDDGNTSFQWTGGATDGEPNVDTQNGFIKNTNAGMQYSNKWSDKHNLNLTPKYNNQIYTNNNSRLNRTQIGENQLNDNTTTNTNVDRSNYKFNVVYDVKLDTINSLKITASSNFYNTANDDFTVGSTTDENGVLKNKRQIFVDNKSDKQAISTNVLFKHKFAKPRRTLSVSTSWNLLNSSLDGFLKSSNDSYANGVLSGTNLINQNKIGERNTQSSNINFTYTEPLSKKFALQFAYQLEYNIGQSKQLTYDFSDATNQYDILIADLSNQFKQTITVNKPALKISYNSKKINYSFGSGFGITKFDLLDRTMKINYDRRFTNIFPAASFSYKYKGNANLHFSYNGSTRQPTIDQLQPLRNNQDFFNQVVGNPDLKQSFTNSFNISQNSYDMLSESNIYQGCSFRTTSNQISYNNEIDPQSAKTIRKAINTNGNFSGNYYMGYNFKIKKIELEVGLNPSVSFNRNVISINNILNTSDNVNSNFRLSLMKSKEKKYDFSLSNEFSNSRNETTQNNEIRTFNTNDLSFNGSVYIAEKWKLMTDYTFSTRQKTIDFQTNLSNQIWNARLERTFKNDEFTAYILVRDILNQNIGIERSNFQNTISEERNDRLQRYAMLGFTWNFKNKGKKKPEASTLEIN